MASRSIPGMPAAWRCRRSRWPGSGVARGGSGDRRGTGGLDPESDFVHAAEGWKRQVLGDGRGARKHFREALRINPMNRWAKAGLENVLALAPGPGGPRHPCSLSWSSTRSRRGGSPGDSTLAERFLGFLASSTRGDPSFLVDGITGWLLVAASSSTISVENGGRDDPTPHARPRQSEGPCPPTSTGRSCS